jgi:hypothetical protein
VELSESPEDVDFTKAVFALHVVAGMLIIPRSLCFNTSNRQIHNSIIALNAVYKCLFMLHRHFRYIILHLFKRIIIKSFFFAWNWCLRLLVLLILAHIFSPLFHHRILTSVCIFPSKSHCFCLSIYWVILIVLVIVVILLIGIVLVLVRIIPLVVLISIIVSSVVSILVITVVSVIVVWILVIRLHL